MPYIKHGRREALLNGQDADTPGELNYLITTLVLDYVARGGFTYDNIAEVTGVLENVKQEFYRRVAAPYEDQKCRENGDVF